jgi:hypothetical protein
MKRHPLLAVFILCGLLAACGPTGSGEIVSEEREVGEFEGIEVSGGIELILTVNPNLATSVIVTYDDNVVDRIRTEVDGSTLRIDSKGSFNIIGGEGRFVEVAVARLEGLTASGGSTVVGEGGTEALALEASGGADVDLSLLPVTALTLQASGGASVIAHAGESITGEASGGADVVVLGDPALQDIDVSGGAEVSNGEL